MEYLEATHESPAAAAEAWAVERAHVHYYVRKLVNAGVPRSERTDASAQSRAPSPVLEEQESDSYKVWCEAWAFAAELRATHGMASGQPRGSSQSASASSSASPLLHARNRSLLRRAREGGS